MKNVLLLLFLMFSFTAFSQIDTDASNITIECGEDSSIQNWLDSNGGAMASTGCGTVVWSNDFSSTSGLCSEEITVTFTATNSCGSFQTIAVLSIQDTQAPSIISFPPDLSIECGSDDSIADLTAEDNCSNINISFSDSVSNGSCLGEEIISRIWTVIDDCGNATSHFQTISINDFTPPSITSPAIDVSVSCDGSGNVTDLNNWLSSNGGAIASDSCGDVFWTNDFTSLDSDCSESVSTTVAFFATDSCGNTTSTSATFTIENVLNECPSNGTFTSQAEIDAFPINYPNCSVFDESIGWLDVSGDDVVDLTPLAGLTQIYQIFIHDTPLLTDLDGLQNITSTSEDYGPFIILQDNQSLTDISALGNLVVTGSEGNGGIGIRRNPSLSSLNGLQGFSAEIGFIDIQDNDSLTNLIGLNNILGADDFDIKDNDSLINLEGINSFTVGSILIENNSSFQNFIGLNSAFGSGIQLIENPIVESLEGLEVLTSLFGLFLENNSSLSDISAIENIQIGSGSDASLVITDNPNLSVCAYPSICNTISYCESLFCYIEIENNAPGCSSIAEVAFECNLGPSNDECVEAITIELGESIQAYNELGTQSPQIPSCNDTNRIDVWFTFNSSTLVLIDIVTNAGYNLQLWEGDCSALTQVDNACGVNQLNNITVAENTDYYLQVWSEGTSRATGLFDVLVQDATLSIQDNEFSGFELFPNPINSILNFKGNNPVSSANIFNAIGQNIMSLSPNTIEGTIDTSNMSSGLYFVKVKINNKVRTFKVLKE